MDLDQEVINKFKIFVYTLHKKLVDDPGIEDPFLNDTGLGEMGDDYFYILSRNIKTSKYWVTKVEKSSEGEFCSVYIYENGEWVLTEEDFAHYFPEDGSPNRYEVEDIIKFGNVYLSDVKYMDHIYTMKIQDVEEMFREADRDKIKTFNDINESIEPTFIEWLSRKLQRKIGKRIGKGIEGVVHKFGKDKVIKITTTDVAEQHKSLNKNIRGLAKIYQIGFIIPPKKFTYENTLLIDGERIKSFQDFYKSSTNIDITDDKVGYIIMEKVDTDPLTKSQITFISDELMTVFLKRNTKKFPEDFQTIINNERNDKNGIGFYHTLSLLYKLIQKNSNIIKPFFKKNYPKLSKYNRGLFFEIIDILISIKKYYPDWTDIHSGQFGKNKNGELVAFDIGSWSGYENYPTPKNIIREFKNFLPR